MKTFHYSKPKKSAWLVLFIPIFLSAIFIGRAQSVSDLCNQADNFSRETKFADAKRVIESALAKDGGNYEVLWRAARVYIEFAETQPENQQENICLKAKEFADKAISVNANGMQGYIRRSQANGKLALFKGVFSVAGLVKASRDDAEKAIQLNNAGNLVLASAYYILGRIHLKLCEKPKLVRLPLGLGFGNMDAALKNLKKAVELRFGFIMFHLDYARALVEEDKYQEAKNELYKIPSMTNQAYEDEKRKQEAAQLLEKIKNK